jgi:biopolymer transport protein ExbD
MNLRDKYSASSKMSLTPMVDVIFMLLIIVIITAPLMHAQIDLSLPKSSAAHITDESSVTVSIKKDGSIFLGTNKIEKDKLPRLIWQIKEEKNISLIELRADRKIEYGKVMEIIGLIKEGGIENVGLVAIPEDRRK